MFPRFLGRRPKAITAAAGAAVLAAAALPVLAGSASAGTTSNPLTLGTSSVTFLTQAGGTPGPAFPGQTTNGLLSGDTLRVRVDANAGQNVFSMSVRICKDNAAISNSAQFAPTSGSQCVSAPLASGTNNVVNATGNPAPNANTFAQADIIVGAGTNTYTDQGGNAVSITCGVGNPCELWVQANMTTGNQYAFYPLTYASTPAAPDPASATPGDGTVAVAWTAPSDTGGAPISQYTVTPSIGSPVNVAGNQTSTNVAATNFTSYSYTVTATNARGLSSGTANAGSAIPGPNPPTIGSALPGDQSATVSWSAPANTTGLNAIQITAYAGPTFATPGVTANISWPATQGTITGLTNGTQYRFTVRGVYTGGSGPESGQSNIVTPNGKFVSQDISADRPVGTLEIAEACATGGSLAFGTYPQTCAVNLGTGVLNAAATYYVASGAIQPVSVRDLRDVDAGWTVNAQVSSFSSGTDSFAGGCLGFAPAAAGQSTTPTYTQTVTAGAAVPANCGAAGLTASTPVMAGGAGAGLGRADLTGPLTLNIPVSANAGTYTATLTFTVL